MYLTKMNTNIQYHINSQMQFYLFNKSDSNFAKQIVFQICTSCVRQVMLKWLVISAATHCNNILLLLFSIKNIPTR
jgi:hypothetical protein